MADGALAPCITMVLNMENDLRGEQSQLPQAISMLRNDVSENRLSITTV